MLVLHQHLNSCIDYLGSQPEPSNYTRGQFLLLLLYPLLRLGYSDPSLTTRLPERGFLTTRPITLALHLVQGFPNWSTFPNWGTTGVQYFKGYIQKRSQGEPGGGYSPPIGLKCMQNTTFLVLLRSIFAPKTKTAPQRDWGAKVVKDLSLFGPEKWTFFFWSSLKVGQEKVLNFGEDLFFCRSPNFGRKNLLNFG